MKNKRILKLILALVLFAPLSLLSACSSNPDGLKLMKEVKETMSDVTSMRMKMNMDMKIKMSMEENNLSMNMSMKADIDVNNDPAATHGTMKVKMDSFGQKQTTETEMYMTVEHDEIIQYQNVDGAGWEESYNRIPMTVTELYSMSDEMLEKSKFKVSNGDKINGKETYEIEVSVNSDDFAEMMEDTADEKSLGDLDTEDFTMKYSLFVDKDSKRVLKLSCDLKNQFAKLLGTAAFSENLPENSDVSFDKFLIELSFSDFNKVDKIVIPDEVTSGVVGDEENYTTYGDVSTQTHAWESGKITVDGVEITLMESTLQTLLDAGYTIDESYEKAANKIDANDSEYISLMKDGVEISVAVENPGNNKINLNEGVISYLSTYSLNTSISLPGGITKGSTKEAIMAAYGQANTMDTEYSESWEYTVDDASGYKTLSIYFEAGALDSFSISVY